MRKLEFVYIFYLGLIPALGSFAGIALYDRAPPPNWLTVTLLVGGVVAVGVYLGMLTSYVGFPTSPWLGLVMILDGPAQIGLSVALREQGTIWHLFGEMLLVETAPIYAAIFVLALHSDKPTRDQRIGSLVLMVLAVAPVVYLVGPPTWSSIRPDLPIAAVPLVTALAAGLYANYRYVRKDEVVRGPSDATLVIVGFLFLWIAALCVAVAGWNAGWFS